jgi:hypothetical protein
VSVKGFEVPELYAYVMFVLGDGCRSWTVAVADAAGTPTRPGEMDLTGRVKHCSVKHPSPPSRFDKDAVVYYSIGVYYIINVINGVNTWIRSRSHPASSEALTE